jgi:5'-methylthioadenosine phosphorylase
MDKKPFLGVIGGSGLYEMEGLKEIERLEMETPFGEPSSPIVLGSLNGRRVAFLARHGLGHRVQPSEINYHANIYALKSLGIDRILSVSACGSLREDYAPGHFVIPDQLYDNTKNRKYSFFREGLVAHIGVADPFCSSLSKSVFESITSSGGTAHDGGTFITIEGPRFSTRGESNTYRAWGMSIIGMTTSPEAFLAREAEICYAVMAHVTDYDVWHISEEPVSVELVYQILQDNTELAQRSVARLVAELPEESQCECHNALRNALITNVDVIPEETRRRLDFLVGRYLPR